MRAPLPCRLAVATSLLAVAAAAFAQSPAAPTSAEEADDRAARAAFLPPSETAPAAPTMGVVPLADNVELGIGRFSVQDTARRRSHIETERHPTDMRLRHRGIAGLGLKLSF